MIKIIEGWLNKMIPKIISKNQGGFMAKRQIVDNIILVQEAIHSSKLKGDKGMLIKLDMANAFDRVKRSFLFEVMRKLKFWFYKMGVFLYKQPLDLSSS